MRFACNECRKKFRTEGALEMHNQSKHREPIVARQHRRRGRNGVRSALSA